MLDLISHQGNAKTDTSYSFKPTVYSKRHVVTKCVMAGELEPSYTPAGNVKWGSSCGKYLAVPLKIKHGYRTTQQFYS